MYELDPAEIGRFDVVLFMGVLYHLKHPLLALEKRRFGRTRNGSSGIFRAAGRHRPGTHVEERPLMEFFEVEDFGGQLDNWVGPTLPCLMAMCRTAGFARVNLKNVQDYGAAITCERKWPESSMALLPELVLVSALHNDNHGRNFSSSVSSDDHVICRLATELELTRESVWPEVDEYGAAPVFVGKVENQWQVNFKLPPGLAPGIHAVRIRTPPGPEQRPRDLGRRHLPGGTLRDQERVRWDYLGTFADFSEERLCGSVGKRPAGKRRREHGEVVDR